MKPSRNQFGPHRPAPPCPPIDPGLVYPFRRLIDWGFGARTVAGMQRDGLKVLRFSKWKFVRGSDLIVFLESAGRGGGRATGGGHGQ